MRINGLNHITVNVVDLVRSKSFYREVLGLEEAGFVDMGDHTLTYYSLPGNVRLELIDYLKKEPLTAHKETDIGTYRHFCLEADSLKELAEICRKNGVFVRKEPGYVEKLKCDTMLITDPNGVEIEIIQK